MLTLSIVTKKSRKMALRICAERLSILDQEWPDKEFLCSLREFLKHQPPRFHCQKGVFFYGDRFLAILCFHLHNERNVTQSKLLLVAGGIGGSNQFGTYSPHHHVLVGRWINPSRKGCYFWLSTVISEVYVLSHLNHKQLLKFNLLYSPF